MIGKLLNCARQIVTSGLLTLQNTLRSWTKPSSNSFAGGCIHDLTSSKVQLVIENALLRQQLIVLNRSVTRPRLTPADRMLVVLLASRLQRWKQALLIVKPETVLRWHQRGFKLFWKRKSRTTARPPKLPATTITLIKEMAMTNRLWGADRIRGELLKLEINVAKRTIQRYIRQARPSRPQGQTWATFLRNHAPDIWACDFLQVYDLFFQPLFAFVITEHGSRRIVHIGVTRSPNDAWVAQQLREATPFGAAPTYLIRDNDAKYGAPFDAVAVGTGIKVLRTPIKAPRANAICERLLGSVRRECLDHIVILSEAHLRRVLTEYQTYFNGARPHQGIGQQVPASPPATAQAGTHNSKILAVPVLGGLHHEYRWAA
jgi:putative transposase